jgi:hypothetical protein
MQRPPTLEPVRFGEFLRERSLISEEQWLAALASHWSDRQLRIGDAIVAHGYLPRQVVESEARVFHDDLDVIEIVPRSERVTAPLPTV